MHWADLYGQIPTQWVGRQTWNDGGYGLKDGVIEVEGTIVEALPNAMFRVS